MGLLCSKKISLTDILINIDDKIDKTKKSIVALKIHRSNFTIKYYFYSLFSLITALSYSYYVDYNLVLTFVLSLILFLVLKFIFTFYFDLKINRKEKLLSELKEKQKINIDELKKQRLYVETKELVDKFEKKNNVDLCKNEGNTKMLDKIASIVLGDDPAKMYALICENCHYHNGLRHPDDYEIAKFYCFNCNYLNDKSIKKTQMENNNT
ncbi:hypothetical protein COBT_001383 [Conglomerata obtusa]